jgi:small nuclear ribonucleoprotein (snRNP)-like protein
MIDLEQFIYKTVVVTREDGITKEGVIVRSDTFNWPYKLVFPDGNFNTFTREGYWYNKNASSAANIKSIKLKEEEPMIDLEQFINKTVVVTREDGSTREGIVTRNEVSINYPYLLQYPDKDYNCYARDGYHWKDKCPNPINIKSIRLKEEPMSLQQQIEETKRKSTQLQEQLTKLEEELLKQTSQKTYQNCAIGDTVDNYLVVDKKDNWLLIADVNNPIKSAEPFKQVLKSGWFIPSKTAVESLFHLRPELREEYVFAGDTMNQYYSYRGACSLGWIYYLPNLNELITIYPFKIVIA